MGNHIPNQHGEPRHAPLDYSLGNHELRVLAVPWDCLEEHADLVLLDMCVAILATAHSSITMTCWLYFV